MWFISDFHFGHKNVIEYCNRPFKNVNDMNDALVRNFCNTVPEGGVCFILGDLWDPTFLSRFANRRIILVLGNHDKPSKKRRIIQETIEKNQLDVEVYKYPILVNKYLWCSHEPMEGMSQNSPYINIHGHIHNNVFGPGGSYRDGNRWFNVSVEQIDYKPIHIKEIIERMGIGEKTVDPSVRVRLLNETIY